MKTQYVADRIRYRSLDTEALRETFLLETLFAPGEVTLHSVVDVDRAVVGTVVPTDRPLSLPAPEALRAEFFCRRRELGIINLGGGGDVDVDGDSHALAPRDMLYVGRDSREVAFRSTAADAPARFYLLSYPAHTAYPTRLIRQSEANRVDLGADETANKRVIRQYIHEDGAPSCQLVMGYTELATGSVWNTMPPHTHDRRSEVYLYFDIEPGQRVLHLMGEPSHTRGLWVGEGQAVISPPWSIHCGAGTGRYCFVWGMGGENQRFADMDGVPAGDLR
jgi:4-deoxy-L-threo-5-hexosulose-uronate ketol-isomerase